MSRSSGRVNAEFQRIAELFRTRCGARWHWGKEGWTRHAKCFDGAAEYPNTWCHFGCAVQVGVGRRQGAAAWAGGQAGAAASAGESRGAPAERWAGRCIHLCCPPLCHPTSPQELDPTGKFASEWDGWVWKAQRGSAAVPFASCCGPQGFSAQCTCAPRGPCN